MKKGLQGEGRWKAFKGNKDFAKHLDKLDKILKNSNTKTYRICKAIPKEDPTGCYGKNGKGKCELDKVDCSKEWNQMEGNK